MKEKLMNDLKDSMKNKEVIRKNTIQLIRSSILKYEKDNKIEADDNKIINIISKERKIRLDALSDFENAGRQDLIDKTNEELKILEEYLPKQLTDDELKHELLIIINNVDAWSPSDLGLVMRAAKQDLENKADGKRMSMMIKELLLQRQKEGENN